MERLVIRNLTKTQNRTPVVSRVSFTLHAGEIFALVGLPGSGKTLVTKMILDLVKKTNGAVRIDGQNHLRALRTQPNLGAVFSGNIYSLNTTPRAKLLEMAWGKGIRVSKTRVGNILNLLGLSSVANTNLKNLTPSQITRLKLATAFIVPPKILILDDCFENLTTEEAFAIRLIIKSLADKGGVAVLVTGRTLAGLEEICDTIGILERGILNSVKSYNQMLREKKL